MIWSKTMKKEINENNSITEPVVEQKNDNFLQNIPTKDDEILKKLDEVNKKLESFEIDEGDEKEVSNKNKKDLTLTIAFIALIIIASGFLYLKKEVKINNE